MPRFEIHDSDTGLKLLVEGPGEPTHEEAAQLVQDELSFLRTNLYYGPEGRVMLDVGPQGRVRHVFEEELPKLNESINRLGELYRREASRKALDKATRVLRSGGDWGEGPTPSRVELARQFYNEELAKVDPVYRQKLTPKPTSTQEALANIDPDTLILISHGASTGGLYSEGGQRFTLGNLAKVLGPERAARIKRVHNLACYGGQCSPGEFEEAFPNVEQVEQSDPRAINIVSIGTVGRGEYFATNTAPGLWQRLDWLGRESETEPSWIEEPIWSGATRPVGAPIPP